MISNLSFLAPVVRRPGLVVTAAACIALVPPTLVAQARNDTSATADTSSGRASLVQSSAAQPITLCIVPGSGTAYRVGGPGLPTQCLAASHTPLSLNLTGPQGVQGPQGAKGDSGTAGLRGETGAKGDSGAVGAKGETGAVGPKGDTGEAGTPAVAGPQGDAGRPGDAGPVGPAGPTGETGAAGAPGAPGVNGAAGLAGQPGAPGAAGAAGIQGIPGTQGEPGAPGTTDHSALINLDTDSHPQYLLAGPRTALNGFSVSGTIYQGTVAPTGAGTRMVWNPQKSAFRAGSVDGDGWDDDQIGYWSTAFGNNSQAPGNAAFAGGWNSRAGGSESLAMGINAKTEGRAAVAFSGEAWGMHSMAVGNGSLAIGEHSIALGQGAEANGVNSVSIGHGKANASRSVNIGTDNHVDGEQSIIIGHAATSPFAGSIILSAQKENAPSRVFSTAENQLVARASGGIIFWTNDELSMGAELPPGSGSWSMVSDRNKKTSFRDVDGESLLAKLRRVPVSSWTYKAQDQAIRHIGPMAQDWQQAFGLSTDSTTINTGDIAGVTLGGVQALDVRTAATSLRVVSHEERIAQLELLVEELMAELRASRAAGRRD